ncbi:MAG: flagellar hook-basal body complex protein FliE [Desulfuromonadaceae bacterium]|jgi:flagellar hook-basal body complex protein FliE|nr:flagellar hook-basal body complex protein FliE [Desulfuromonas sp.]MDY0184986.1 flagellar hook-basal body complex protein FliE [Desulfuromonadaceae bacterium]
MIKDISIDTHLKSLFPTSAPQNSASNTGFADMLADAVSQTNQAQLDADKAAVALQTGKAENLHEVMLSMEEADISMRLLVQMRNKALDAYQEIMRMQV